MHCYNRKLLLNKGGFCTGPSITLVVFVCVNESLQKRGMVHNVVLSGGQWRSTSAGEQIWKI